MSARGKRVSPVSPLPGSVAGFAGDVREWFHSGPQWAAPAMSVAAAEPCCQPQQVAR